MDRESQELRPYSRSWPPGSIVGSVVVDGGARVRRRDGLMLIALAVCGWCLGYAVTDWVCDSNKRKLAAASAQQSSDAIGLQRSSAELAAGVKPAAASKGADTSAIANASEAAAHAEVVDVAAAAHAEVVDVAATALAAPTARSEQLVPLKAATRTPAPKPASSRCCRKPAHKLVENEEPSPVVSPEELDKALALAAASKKIFASVDDSSQPIIPQPSAAAVTSPEHASSHDNKVVAIEGLYVEGGVPSKVVNRGVQRLLPHYDRCRELCDTEPQRMKLSTTIDEAGHGRQVTVEGLSRPGLRRCLEQATAHLVVPAPDTGTARARWIVRFAAR